MAGEGQVLRGPGRGSARARLSLVSFRLEGSASGTTKGPEGCKVPQLLSSSCSPLVIKTGNTEVEQERVENRPGSKQTPDRPTAWNKHTPCAPKTHLRQRSCLRGAGSGRGPQAAPCSQ